MKLLSFIIVVINYQNSLQDCPEEVSNNGISVLWRQTSNATNIESEPVCYDDEHIVKRNCTDNQWTPPLDDLEPCLKVVKVFNLTTCPPTFHKISNYNTDYCYQLSPSSSWNYPCFSSGGASIITDLDTEEINYLIDSLIATNTSRYFWLPAQRQKLFHPVVWFIPGPNWGNQVVVNHDRIRFHNLFWKNCLALDVENRELVTAACSSEYPSLCFYINKINYPAICPKDYHAFRYRPDNGTCFGIEHADSETGWTFNEFLNHKCDTPMDDHDHELNSFIFAKIAELNNLPASSWCWFKTSHKFGDHYLNITNIKELLHLEAIVNNLGTLGLMNASSTLPCMACEKEVIYAETELMFEYNALENRIYLTIYFPSGLWKYDSNDKGVQCFSDAKGFVRVVTINDSPYMSVQGEEAGLIFVEKVVYIIDLITDGSAQYWCEGHTFNFSLISTNKIVVNPRGKEVHVFSLTLNYHNITSDITDMPDLDSLLLHLTKALDARKILLMDIYDLTPDYITILLHIHAAVSNTHDDEALNILNTYNRLKKTIQEYLPLLNCTFLNFTSSLYCLPEITHGKLNDSLTLDWELTAIGHISAPKQFCLQSNGLPVKRQCRGSYHLGGSWGPVEGVCDTNYTPTNTTTFLYNIIIGQAPSNYTERFLTLSLSMVLSDTEAIIPADIYYLSISLQQILSIAQENVTSVDIGDINNIAWVMDRVMDLDCDYLRLAQTLNSTNVIIHSINNIIEILAKYNSNKTITRDSTLEDTEIVGTSTVNSYQLAIKSQFLVQISYPRANNISGIAISKAPNANKFTDMRIHTLYVNTTLEEVLSIENLEIATWFPLRLLKTLQRNDNQSNPNGNQNDVHIVVSVYKNNAVFQELITSNHKINSRIVGVSIPGFNTNLEIPLPLVFKQLNPTNSKGTCGFWDFQTESTSQVSGFWKTNGCFPVKSVNNSITVCECYHLTHFSQLMTLPGNKEYARLSQHARALNAITLVGCFLSLIGVVGIFITALVFSNWRKKAGTKVLLHLSSSIAIPLVIIVTTNLDNTIFVRLDDVYVVADHMRPVCMAIGALLHYSILASFMWMLITAVLQFIRYVRVLGVSRPSRFMCKFALIGWGIPLIPVIIVAAVDIEGYIPASSMCKSICYPKGYYFILGVMVPICIILLANVVLFVLVLHAISGGPNEKMKSTDIDLVGAQLRLSIFLFFLLGLTWIFGIFSFSKSLIWSYMFCLTATLQGFVLFIYFIICDPATRKMWITLVKPSFSYNSSRNSVTSIS